MALSLKKETSAGYEGMPSEIQGRIALVDGVLHVSSELRGNALLAERIELLRRRGISKYVMHQASEFDRKYANLATTEIRTENDFQDYAVDLIGKAHKMGASDIHIKDRGKYTLIRFRVLGLLQDYTQLEGGKGRQLISSIYQSMTQSADSAFSPKERQDGRIASRKFLPQAVHSIRVHTEPTECVHAVDGTATTMLLRLLYDSTEAKGSLEERAASLGFTPRQQDDLRFLSMRTGLNIISGPTGHGKSTLLKHLMESMAEDNPEKSFMSIEDPPEFPMRGVDQVLVSTKAGTDPLLRGRAYTDAIAGTMRSDPDTLMIGEIRYPEAAVAAINAAMTGHGVWGTIHANNAFGIVPRMVSLLNAANFVESLDHFCDPNVLAGLTYQRLVPVLCSHCKIPLQDAVKRKDFKAILPEKQFDILASVLKAEELENVHVRGAGCDHCRKMGFVRQTVAAEVVVTDPKMLMFLRQGKATEARTYWMQEKQGLSYVRHALDLIAQGVADPMMTQLRLGVPLDFEKSFNLVGK